VSAVVVAGDGDVDALGDGLGCVETVEFEFVGAGAQPVVSTIRNQASMQSRRIIVMRVFEQRAFHRGAAIYMDFLNDLRTMRALARPVV